ncbi:MAG: hypothetical protein R3C59_14705 [Planctomycetaceae bacterium]
MDCQSSDTTEGTVSPPLTFTPLNWNQAQTVTVSGQNDDVDDGDITYSIQVLPAVINDPLYNGLDANDVSVTGDNDSVGVTVSAISNDTESGGGNLHSGVEFRTHGRRFHWIVKFRHNRRHGDNDAAHVYAAELEPDADRHGERAERRRR